MTDKPTCAECGKTIETPPAWQYRGDNYHGHCYKRLQMRKRGQWGETDGTQTQA